MSEATRQAAARLALVGDQMVALFGAATVVRSDACGCSEVRYGTSGRDVTCCEEHARAQYFKH